MHCNISCPGDGVQIWRRERKGCVVSQEPDVLDDATGGASTLGAAKQVSQDMEDILENGGFRFKETVMSGDPLGRIES
jgi:hypothetical protein